MSFACSVISSKVTESLLDLQRLWDLELLGISKNEEKDLTKEEYQAQQMQDACTWYDKDSKTWTTSLLFKDNPPKLGSNRAKALGILKKVENSTIQKGVQEEVNKAFNEFVEKGFAEEVIEDQEPDAVHYLPGHAVFREESVTTKTRIVFNASATSDTGKSLNQCLFQGQCLLPDLVKVIIRFRLMIIGFALDISKMFLRIKLEHGKDYLRYFWRNCDQDSRIKTFRMKVVTFGIISSPFQAIDVVLKHADLFEKEFPKAVQVVREQLYMDDVLSGAVNLETAKGTIKEIMDFFMQASMQPHKFASNLRESLECVPEEYRSQEVVHKVLGVLWDTSSDQLSLKVTELPNMDRLDTKRTFLETSAKIYDPLGLIAPFTTKIKILFQQVWAAEQGNTKTAKSWDKPLPDFIQELWDEIKRDIPNLGKIEIPRCPFVNQGPPMRVEIFAFGDASQKAYATVIYLLGTHSDGSKSSHLTLARTRVAPLKMVQTEGDHQTIVRLELLAALITARAAAYVKDTIRNHIPVADVHFFTDSLINLCRIRRGPSKYKLWVANRVEEILKLSNPEDWHHCPGVLNPADLPSRGLSAEDLKNSTLWWTGPDFIKKEKSSWPTDAEVQIREDPEQRNTVDLEEDWKILAAKEENSGLDWNFVRTLLDRRESWHLTIWLFARILRMGAPHHKKFRRKPFSVEERMATEKFLWRLSQKQFFSLEFRTIAGGQALPNKSNLTQYNLFFDETDCLLRSNTRLALSNLPEETKRAILLPKDCPIVEKFIMHRHKLHQHAGAGYLHALFKQEFLIPQGRRMIKKVIRKCTTKRCVVPVPLGQQEAPLPALRIDDPAPFQVVAVDLFGPMMVFHDCGSTACPHHGETKVHCALFTCFHSRAVHLELVDNAGTEAFMDAFRLLCARRGTPSTMYSDNAKGFKAASKEIRALYRSINWNAVKQEGVKKNIEWSFSMEKAPHQNGLCERLVRTVKTPLRVVIGAARLTKNQLRLILTEIEAVVNNRPLAVVREDSEELTPITPMELVNGRRLDQIPDPRAPKRSTTFSHLWRKRQAILNQFWKRWHNDYLLEQSTRKKWRTPTRDNLMGKIVLIKDDNLSRNVWVIGRIVDILPSKDGLVRNVMVKTSTSLLRRAVQKLALFENY